jgi:ATP-dependent Lhr-like helicase
VVFIDTKAAKLLEEGRKYFAAADLANKSIFGEGNHVMLATWAGDWVNDALVVLLRAENLDAWNQGAVVSITGSKFETVMSVLQKIGTRTASDLTRALSVIQNVENEKWDWALPDDVKRAAFASLRLDMQGGVEMARRLVAENQGRL